jgi:RNAse (barnase) inhibitor barstar
MTILSITSDPWVLRTVAPFKQLLSQIELSASIQVVVLEGGGMRSTEGFYAEIANKMKLPDYYGKNLNALDECVTDLEWIDYGLPVVVIVRDAELMLNNDRELLHGFLDVMTSAGEEWSRPIQDGNDWDRPAVPFHVILHFESSNAVGSEFGSIPVLDQSDPPPTE